MTTTNRTDCQHFTSATVDGDRRCADCGCDWYSEAAADKRERANAKAAAKAAAPVKVKDQTAGSFEARECDREARRNRYARTGR
jgi:hypothetical protein